MLSPYNIPQASDAATRKTIASCGAPGPTYFHYPAQGSINRAASAVPAPGQTQPSGYVNEHWRRSVQNAPGARMCGEHVIGMLKQYASEHTFVCFKRFLS